MEQDKTGKYFKYAIGEILLVVIGILIALQINNWNEGRLEQATLNNYYERMYEELESSRDNLSRFTEQIGDLINTNRKTLEILSSNNTDSVKVLESTLGALGTAWETNFNFPLVEEFINEGYLSKVKNIKIKDELQAFSIQLTKFISLDDAINSQYATTIEPFINKNLNYSQIALDSYKKNLVSGGPQTNFNNLFNNLEVWNVITLKLELLVSQKLRLQAFEAMIERLTSSLEEELKK